MVKCTHLLEDRIYLISGKSIEGLEIFRKASEKRKMKSNIKEYLVGICSIFHIEIDKDEFHIVLRMKSRKMFKSFYIEKFKGRVKESFFIPESTYIFGRQMSNLQVSFVKHYNWKNNRKGVIIDGRYRRYLIESPDEMEEVIERLKRGTNRISNLKGKIGTKSRKHNQEDGLLILERFSQALKYSCIDGIKIDLRGCFSRSVKTSLIPEFHLQKIKNFRRNHPCGPNYN